MFFLCSGLGTTQRGYEDFFDSLFIRLKESNDLQITLFKGGGPDAERERRLWNLPRQSKYAVWLGEKLGRGNREIGRGYYIEQLTFFFALLPHLIIQRPQIVYVSDKDLCGFLSRWKRLTKQSFSLLFRNGGQYPPPYIGFDYVQQVTKPFYQRALNADCSPDQQIFLPEGFDLEQVFRQLSKEEKKVLQRRLSLPTDRPVVLCVSAVNCSSKRVDYVVREISRLPSPQPFLQVLGQFDKETPAILKLAESNLTPGNYAFGSTSVDELKKYYSVADLFVLASFREGFGRVMVEALAAGLPCLAHDYDIPKYVLAEHGYYADFRQPGALAKLIIHTLEQTHPPQISRERHAAVYQRFSWDVLLSKYIETIQKCAAEE